MNKFFAEPLSFLKFHTLPRTVPTTPWVVRERTRWKDAGRGWPRFTGTEVECKAVSATLNALERRAAE